MSKFTEQNRNFEGVWIPKEVWLNADLSLAEKCLLVEINSLDNSEERGCYATNEYLASFLGVSEGRLANMLTDLKKRGLVLQVYFDGRNRGLRVPKSVLGKSESRLHENVKAVFPKMGKQGSRKRENKVHENVNIVIQNSNTHISTDEKGENEFSPPPGYELTTKENSGDLEIDIYEPVRRETLRLEVPEKETTSNGARRDVLGDEFADLMANQFGAKIVAVKPAEPPVKAWRPFDIESELDALTTDYTVAENFTLSRKIPKAKFSDYVAAFRLESKAQGGEYHGRKDFRQHFFNWAFKRHESEQRKAAQSVQGIPTISDNLKTQTKRPLNPIC